jgi:catechol 2,3-dioxygenase-like lactoylglutathione lyase family enzyme
VTERWRDVAHIGHAELLTPTPEASLEYFTALLGLTVVAKQGESWYLRGYGNYESYCLKLTASPSPGLGHMAVRAWSPEALARRVSWLKDAGVPGGWVEPEAGKGPAYEFTDPDGHRIRIYYETAKYVPHAADLVNDAGVPIEAGPSRHIPIQGFYLYTREPGGNRIEICSGGYLGFDPDDNPVVWTPTEYAATPGWGARLPSTFRTCGTPPLGVPEESVTSDWPAPALRKFSVRRVQRHRVARN